jgi:AmmeMemoRadiSam system protein B
MFYPGDTAMLGQTVDQLLAVSATPNSVQPKVLIVPHAGYVYSGATAARAYARLTMGRTIIRRVVLLGPTHRVAVNGMALPTVSAFSTPLGNIPLDCDVIAELKRFPQVVFSDQVHAQEHSLEVQLPFLQTVLDDFTLIPIAVGNCPSSAVAEVINYLWGGPETMIVISTDLSHFLPYAEAKAVDTNTCRHILNFDSHIRPDQACGAFPMNGLLLVAQQRQLTIQQIDLCNSGDTAGDKQRVVGYAAFVLNEVAHE